MGQNPLTDLLRLIDSIRESNGGPYNTQIAVFESGKNSRLQLHLRASKLLSESIRAVKLIGAYNEGNEKVLEELWSAITVPDGSWFDRSMGEISSMTRTAVENLALLLDSSRCLPVTLNDEQLDTLRAALQKLRMQIEELSEDPEHLHLYRYILYLIDRCLNILDGEDVDLTALRSLSFEIGGAAVEAVRHIPEDDEGKEKMSKIGESISTIISWCSNATAGATGTLLAGAVTGYLP